MRFKLDLNEVAEKEYFKEFFKKYNRNEIKEVYINVNKEFSFLIFITKDNNEIMINVDWSMYD